MWNKADGIYKRSSSGGGGWKSRGRLKKEWYISYDLEIGKKLTFMIKPTGFKHTGLFPEQAANWEWFSNLIRKRTEAGESVKVLNLFAYTGGATGCGRSCRSIGMSCRCLARNGNAGKGKRKTQRT